MNRPLRLVGFCDHGIDVDALSRQQWDLPPGMGRDDDAVLPRRQSVKSKSVKA
ncbi:MAG: hypothetical protein AAF989_04600 [Planctomycetota bacterium]